MLVAFLVVVCLQWAIASFAYWRVVKNRRAILGAACFCLVGFCLVSSVFSNLALFAQFVGLMLLGSAGLVLHMQSKTYCGAALVVSLALALAIGGGQVLAWKSVAREYPLESLRERLAYEQRISEGRTSPRRGRHYQGSWNRSDEELEEAYSPRSVAYRTTGRMRALAFAHSDQVEQFVMSPGFGVGRQITPRLEVVRLPEMTPVQLPTYSLLPDPISAEFEQMPETQRLLAGEESALFKPMHGDALAEFSNAKGFGYVQDLGHVAGFQPHGFSRLPASFESAPIASNWRVTSVQLVSLIKHDQPMVYDSRNLPQMSALVDAPVRALNEFERMALDRLQRGEEIVATESANRLSMLGSIRAATQCLECHSVERKALLGAFTYTMIRDVPIQQPIERKVPKPLL